MYIRGPYFWKMTANIYLGWGIEIRKFPKGFLYIRGDLQDPGGQANVKLRLPFALSKVLTSRQLSS